MTIASILAYAEAGAASRRRLEICADLAGRLGASVTGLFLKPALPSAAYAVAPGAWMPPALMGRITVAHDLVVSRAEGEARANFEAAGFDRRASWLVLGDDLARRTVALARRHDLTVAPPTAMPLTGDFRIGAADLFLASGGPGLVIPDAPSSSSVGRRVLVAWNGGREAARALRDAWPLLASAEAVRVVQIDSSPSADAEETLRRLFKRRDLEIDYWLDEETPAHLAETLLRYQVERWRADLVVIGLYGHARAAEVVLGGVSRGLLAAPPATLFVSH